jgi:hypothetical protein
VEKDHQWDEFVGREIGILAEVEVAVTTSLTYAHADEWVEKY